jgi:uncharacterized protein (TIGR02444 family)
MADASSGPAHTAIQEETDPDNALWRFACAFYAREGVAAACLVLQEQLGVDVNILLFAIFAQLERSIVLTPGDLATVDGLVRDWHCDIVQVLRRLRTRLKTGPLPAPSPITNRLRNRIKATELEAEQIELAVLSDWLDRESPRPSVFVVEAGSVPLMVARYFQARPVAFAPEVDAALDALTQAIREAGAKTADHPS